MKENQLPLALYWLTYSIIALFILSFIPPFSSGNFAYKKINLLADLEPDPVIPNKDSRSHQARTTTAAPTMIIAKPIRCCHVMRSTEWLTLGFNSHTLN